MKQCPPSHVHPITSSTGLQEYESDSNPILGDQRNPLEERLSKMASEGQVMTTQKRDQSCVEGYLQSWGS